MTVLYVQVKNSISMVVKYSPYTTEMMLYVVKQAKHKNRKWASNECRSTWMLTAYSYKVLTRAPGSPGSPGRPGSPWLPLGPEEPTGPRSPWAPYSKEDRQGRVETKPEDIKFLFPKYTLICNHFVRDLTAMHVKTMLLYVLF